jgi:hypothetical protein
MRAKALDQIYCVLFDPLYVGGSRFFTAVGCI